MTYYRHFVVVVGGLYNNKSETCAQTDDVRFSWTTRSTSRTSLPSVAKIFITADASGRRWRERYPAECLRSFAFPRSRRCFSASRVLPRAHLPPVRRCFLQSALPGRMLQRLPPHFSMASVRSRCLLEACQELPCRRRWAPARCFLAVAYCVGVALAEVECSLAHSQITQITR